VHFEFVYSAKRTRISPTKRFGLRKQRTSSFRSANRYERFRLGTVLRDERSVAREKRPVVELFQVLLSCVFGRWAIDA
jgi:hypothetical protein